MCHVSCVVFLARALRQEEVAGTRVLEVGARDFNGSVRPVLESWKPAEYLGTDLVDGRGVDVVCDAARLVEAFGEDSFDLVVSSEMLEHAREWQTALDNMKRVCRPGGLLALTTRSYGYPYHGPDDYWRFEPDDLRRAVADFEILVLERDAQAPGVFLKCRKPEAALSPRVDAVPVYCMLTGRRQIGVRSGDLRHPFVRRLRIKQALRRTHDELYRVLARGARALLRV